MAAHARVNLNATTLPALPKAMLVTFYPHEINERRFSFFLFFFPFPFQKEESHNPRAK